MTSSTLPIVAPAREDVNELLLEHLARLEAKLDRVVNLLERRSRPRDGDDVRVLLALPSVYDDASVFSSAQAMLRARSGLAPELAAALRSADCGSAKSLGHLLRRVEGQTVEGVTVHCARETNVGLWWVLRVQVATPKRLHHGNHDECD